MSTAVPRLLLLAMIAMAAVPAAAADEIDLAPVPLFTAVCTQGGGRLSASEVRESRYLALPPGARLALGFPPPAERGAASGLMEPLASRDVPNRVLAIGRANERFLLPSAADRSGAFAQSCAVVWRGAHFAEARRGVAEIAGMKDGGGDADVSPVSDAHLFVVRGNSYRLLASETGGWTVMRMTDDTPTPAARAAVSSNTTVRDNGHGEIVVKTGNQK